MKTKEYCFECEKCLYIGEGTHVCEDNYEVVLDEWEPTENFAQCEEENK